MRVYMCNFPKLMVQLTLFGDHPYVMQVPEHKDGLVLNGQPVFGLTIVRKWA